MADVKRMDDDEKPWKGETDDEGWPINVAPDPALDIRQKLYDERLRGKSHCNLLDACATLMKPTNLRSRHMATEVYKRKMIYKDLVRDPDHPIAKIMRSAILDGRLHEQEVQGEVLVSTAAFAKEAIRLGLDKYMLPEMRDLALALDGEPGTSLLTRYKVAKLVAEACDLTHDTAKKRVTRAIERGTLPMIVMPSGKQYLYEGDAQVWIERMSDSRRNKEKEKREEDGADDSSDDEMDDPFEVTPPAN